MQLQTARKRLIQKRIQACDGWGARDGQGASGHTGIRKRAMFKLEQPFLVSAVAGEDRPYGARQNVNVQPHRPVADIIFVESNTFGIGGVVASRYLP